MYCGYGRCDYKCVARWSELTANATAGRTQALVFFSLSASIVSVFPLR